MELSMAEKQTSGIPRLSRLPVPNARATGRQSFLPITQLQKGANLTIPRRRPAAPKVDLCHSSKPSDGPASKERVLDVPDTAIQPSNAEGTAIEAVQEPIDGAPAIPKEEERVMADARDTTEPVSQDLVAPQDPETQTSVQRTVERKSRPSLSERTIQTISKIPPSPSPGRRRSSFYQPQSPMVISHGIGTPSKPKPRLEEQKPSGTQPGQDRTPTRTHLANGINPRNIPIPPPMSDRRVTSAPHLRLVNTSLTKAKPTTALKIRSQNTSSSHSLRSPVREDFAVPNNPKGSKSLAARASRPRPSVKESQLELPQDISGERMTVQTRVPARRQFSVKGVSKTKEMPTLKGTNPQSKPLDAQVDLSGGSPGTLTVDAVKAPKSSAALRETIAKAKAARKLAAQKESSVNSKSVAATVEEGSGHPVDLVPQDLDGDYVPTIGGRSLSARVEAARTNGRLNISAMGLREIPKQVLNMYKFETLDSSKGAWYESVDLIHFIAADNELEHIGPEVFPDIDPKGTSNECDEVDNVFVGLETLDLHGNLLRAIPVGLRKLDRLTSLNLSHNHLDTNCLDIISQCLSLKILRLANNELAGDLDEKLTNLAALEVLDISRNSIASLPENLKRMTHLRTLNVSGNGLTMLPLSAIATLPVTELTASKNRISGSLFPTDVQGMDFLQILDVSDNALTSLTDSTTLKFPVLRQLSLARNRLMSLPDVSKWTELVTMDASENRISCVPDGFISLAKIKQVYFTGNNLKTLDDRIGIMESLEILKVSDNPLKQLKYLTMPTEDLKRDLKLRLEPALEEAVEVQVPEGEDKVSDPERPPVVEEQTETWPVTSGGRLDRSSKGICSLDMVILESTSARHTIRSADLDKNMLTSIPLALSTLGTTLTKLTLAHNKMEQNYLTASLELPNLLDLNISCNSITSLNPLLESLSAPALSSLNISANRIGMLPILRQKYPSLYNLIANDNRISELDVDAVDGLKVIDLRNNDIAHLPPKLGLLQGIERLDLVGNVFRVPRWTVLEKGTQATLAWLRDRIPAEESADNDVD